MQLLLPAPAKINHFLHITHQRPDGYHLIQTLFQYLNFSDDLSFSLIPSPDIRITMQYPDGKICDVPRSENLIYKAAKYLQETYLIQAGVDIRVTKKIPMGAGLGGGSSNAATTLLALNFVWNLNLDLITLTNLGTQLGADVPFFLKGQSAWGENIGDQLTFVQLDEPYIVVLTPPCHVSTVKMYQHSQLTRNTSTFRIDTLEGLLGQGQLECAVKNDFEPLVCENYPIVAKYMAWLGQHAQAKLSGSGSSIFAVFEQEEDALRVMKDLPPSYQGFLAKSVNKSPLHTQLGNLGFFLNQIGASPSGKAQGFDPCIPRFES